MNSFDLEVQAVFAREWEGTQRQRARRSRTCIELEPLESRVTPTTFVWTADGDQTSWTDPNNWAHVSPYSNQPVTGVPDAFADVVFPPQAFLTSSSSSTINLNFAYLGMPLDSLTVQGSYTFSGNPFTIENSLSVLPAIPGTTSATFLNAGIDLAAGATIDTASDSTLNIASTSDLTGLHLALAGAVTKVGGGGLVIDTQNITYPNTGPSAATPLVIAGGTVTMGETENLAGVNVQVTANASLAVADNASLTIGVLTGAGNVLLEGTTAASDTTAFSVNVPNATSSTFSGLIDGVGQFTNAGFGTLAIGAIDFGGSGSIHVNAGTLLMDGPISAGALQVGPLGTFGGTGSWNVSGPVVFQTGATYQVSLNGTTPGSQYSQLTDTSSSGIHFNATNLAATVNYEYQAGDQYTIAAAPAITGLFTNVTNGFVLLGGSIPFNVTSTANTITLTAINSLTTTRLAASAAVANPGQSVTFTATVNTRTAAVTTGEVSFLEGNNVITTVPVSSNGTASFTTTLPLGTTMVTAAYSGLGNIQPSSSAPITQLVIPYSSTTTLISLNNPANPGQPVSIVAIVTAGGFPVTSGTVTFRRGLHILGVVPLTANGTATLSIASLPLGKSHIQAEYNGSSVDNPSASGKLTQSIVAYSTSSTLTLVVTPSARGLLEASVSTMSSNQPVPNGSVTFRKNGRIIGQAKVRDGTATLRLPKHMQLRGNYRVTYGGNADYRASKSAMLVISQLTVT
jgi:hypothetical protein